VTYFRHLPRLFMAKKISFISFCLLALISFPLLTKAVTIGPARLEYSTDPGAKLEGNMFLINESDAPQTFYPSFERFTEDNGQKIFTRETSDLSTWFQMSPSETLKPGEQRNIPFVINVPQNAPPGGHFAVIWWSTTPPGDNDKQVAIVTRAGVLVYLTVSGDIKEGGNIESLSIDKKSALSSGPFTFSTYFKNTGNVAIKPIGTVTVKNILGMTSAVIPMNKDGGAILPQSRKGFSAVWADKGFHFGPYHASLLLNFGTNKTAEADQWFWVFSWSGILTLLVLILVIVGLPRIIRRYNRWIIDKARS
jgi:hypothetical protein